MSSAIPFLKNAVYPTRGSVLVQNLSVTFIENVATKGLNFFIILLLTRALGPEDYGKYSFIFVTMALCSALFDFGMDNTAVRFAARDKGKRQSIFGLYLAAKLVILLGLVLFFLVGGQWLFSLMHKEAVSQFLPYLIIGLLGESLFFVNDTYLQAEQRFRLRAILNIARYALMLLYIWILATGDWMRLELAFYIYWVPLLFSLLFLGKYIGFIRTYFKRRLGHRLMTDILQYERWMFVYSIANNLLGRVDFFMLGFWVGFHQLGVYNAAFQLCSVVSFLPLVLGKVLLPTLSELEEPEVFRTSGKVIRATGQVALFAAILIPLVPWVVPLLLGPAYADSTLVLQILLIAFIAGLLSMPYEQALYSVGQPRIMCMYRYGQLALMVILNLMMIPVLGVYGAALSTMVGRVLYLVAVRGFYRSYESGVFRPARVPS